MSKPWVADLYCGLGGWSEGFLAEGYDCIGFDIERHDYGTGGYPGQLIIQDARTIHGSQFRNAAAIVASPPCQKYSYMAMPWGRAKAMAAEIRNGECPECDGTGNFYRHDVDGDFLECDACDGSGKSTAKLAELNELFDTCFRIQREAIEAAGHFIPLVVENVKGAQPWVGRAAWHYGSFYLWGDVPPLMPPSGKQVSDGVKQHGSGANWFDTGIAALPSGAKRKSNAAKRIDQRDVAPRSADSSVSGLHDQVREITAGEIIQGQVLDCFGWRKDTALRDCNSKSPRRKAASALIAKIPFELSSHIARCFKPTPSEARRRTVPPPPNTPGQPPPNSPATPQELPPG